MNRVAVFVALWLAGGCTDLDQLELESRGHHHDDRCGHHRDPVETLADAAARADRRIGTAVDYGPLTTEETYRTILATEFDYVTPGNETKWGSLQPVDPDHWSFERADAIVELATDAGQAIKGHTLVWHSQLPAWVNDSLTPQQLRHHLARHIDRTVRRYRRDIRAWDVVNEAIADDGTLRDTVFLRKLGPGYIAQAFRDAHRADRDARLYYNDYNIDAINPKSDAVYALVKELLRQRVPIDGVGLQMHLEAQTAPSTADMVANMQRFADLGLSVNISELDVRVARLPGDRTTKLAVQKQIYHRVVAACMQVRRCVSITTWGFTDRHSWIDSTFGPDDPLEYDDDYQRKPAWYAIVDGFLEVPPDPSGTAPNLVANATFEPGTTGWTAWGGTLERTTRRAHTGASSLRVSDRTETFHGPVFDARAVVRPGRGYDVSAWAQISAGADTVRLSAKSRCAGAADVYTTLGTATATSTGWVELTGVLAVPSCTLEELAVYLEGPAAGVMLYADDVAVRPQPGELGPNLVANPDFEAGTTGWFGFGGPTLTTTTAQAHGGLRSGLVTNRTAGFQGPATSLLGLVQPGGVYQIEAWARLVNATTGPANLTLKVTCAGTDQFLRVASATASDTAWTLVAGSITIPSCAATEITLYLEGPPAGVDQLIDDVSVRQDFTTVDPNIITNPDFETGTSDWFGSGGPILTSTTAQAHGGTRSLLVTARTASFQGPATSLLAAPAGGYTASGWVRLANATTGEIRLTLKTRCGTTDSYATVGSASVTDTGWTQITGTLTVPSCEPTEVTLYFEGPPAGVELYVDDVVVVAGP